MYRGWHRNNARPRRGPVAWCANEFIAVLLHVSKYSMMGQTSSILRKVSCRIRHAYSRTLGCRAHVDGNAC